MVASLTVALGADPLLLAMPAALAASWGFMLPAGTGPNAIAWSTGRIALPRMVGAGLVLDLIGIVLIVSVVWGIAAVVNAPTTHTACTHPVGTILFKGVA